MIKKLLKKFNGRFENHLPTVYNSNSFLPTFSLKDTTDGEVFTIQIDSLAADPEMVLENVLHEKIINKREQKIDSLINGTTSKKNWSR
jgi:hypothetical protein